MSDGIDRRRFLALGLTAGGIAIATGAGYWVLRSNVPAPPVRGPEIHELADRFEAHFDYLQIDREGLLRFLEAWQSANHSLGALSAEMPYLAFLESSDFFINGADESRPVRFVMLRDPYVNPCFNPFREL